MKYLVDEHHHGLMDDTYEKFHLCLGHRVRVKNKRARVDEFMNLLSEYEAMVVMDFKMKFEAVYYREKTTDFYEKKSSWHGSMIYSRYASAEREAAESVGDLLLDYHTTYFDHISSGDSKQDYVAVMSQFDAKCRRVSSDFLHIRALYFQLDNTRCYKKGHLLLGLYKITISYGMQLNAYIHTGVQDGRGSIGAHCATAMRHVHKYCNMGHDVITSSEIV